MSLLLPQSTKYDQAHIFGGSSTIVLRFGDVVFTLLTGNGVSQHFPRNVAYTLFMAPKQGSNQMPLSDPNYKLLEDNDLPLS